MLNLTYCAFDPSAALDFSPMGLSARELALPGLLAHGLLSPGVGAGLLSPGVGAGLLALVGVSLVLGVGRGLGFGLGGGRGLRLGGGFGCLLVPLVTTRE